MLVKSFYSFENSQFIIGRQKIATNRKTIGDITELSIQAFDQREECQSKIQALQVNFSCTSI